MNDLWGLIKSDVLPEDKVIREKYIKECLTSYGIDYNKPYEFTERLNLYSGENELMFRQKYKYTLEGQEVRAADEKRFYTGCPGSVNGLPIKKRY